MMDLAILMNQVVIMKALLSVVTDYEQKKELEDQIIFTQARIRGMA